MTDIVLPTKHWADTDFLYNVFDDKILVLDFLKLHNYNRADYKDGTATLYNRIKEAIQVAQQKRADYQTLMNLSERELSDLGIGRSQIREKVYGERTH
mgnify:CR=1 FL=1